MHNRHYEKFADGTVKDIEDEIPFEVPEGWEWCRLKNICLEFIVPQRDKPTTFDGNIPWCRIEDIEGKYLNGSLSNQLVSMETIKKMNMHICPKGSIICSCSASLGVQAIVTVDCCTNQTFIGIVPKHEVLFNEYLYYFLGAQTKYFNEIATGTTIKYISRDKFENLLFPLPPIMEQEKTVSAIEHYFSLINAIENDKSDLQTAIKQAKFKILDLAIHGKLVPQDSSDEPASVLLERLRAEKEAKIKAGELKRDKNDSYIYKNTTDNCYYEKFNRKEPVCIDEEIPFDIPDNWHWTKLGRICTKLVDGDHNPPKGIEEKTDYIMASSRNINHNTVEDLGNVRYLTKEMFEIENQRTKATEGDIFFTSVGTLGRSCIYDGSLNICFQRSVSFLNTQIDKNYLKYFFDSNFYQDYVVEHATGTAQLGFYLQEMSESYIAIPPISEQTRIVSKIEEMFERLDQIQNNLI